MLFLFIDAVCLFIAFFFSSYTMKKDTIKFLSWSITSFSLLLLSESHELTGRSAADGLHTAEI